MRTRLLAAGVASLMLTAGATGVALAGPGPNGNNNQGLCTAYFNGQKTGHDKHGSPGPFAALEQAADDGNADNGAGVEDVYRFCGGAESIGGNPDQNGRFTGCFDGDQDGDGQVCDDQA